MTKAQKKQITDTLKLLDSAHDGIKKAMAAKGQEIVLELLSQCQ